MVLTGLMQSHSPVKHEGLYGRALGTMNDRQVISWLFGELGPGLRERKKRTTAADQDGNPPW